MQIAYARAAPSNSIRLEARLRALRAAGAEHVVHELTSLPRPALRRYLADLRSGDVLRFHDESAGHELAAQLIQRDVSQLLDPPWIHGPRLPVFSASVGGRSADPVVTADVRGRGDGPQPELTLGHEHTRGATSLLV
jgi:hypothetical protein